MVADLFRGEVADYLGCVKAADKHEIVVYEGRNQDLSFLVPNKPPERTSSITAALARHISPPTEESRMTTPTEEQTLNPRSTQNIIHKIKNKISKLTQWTRPSASTQPSPPGPPAETPKSSAELWAEREKEIMQRKAAEKKKEVFLRAKQQATTSKVDRHLQQLVTKDSSQFRREPQEYLPDELPLRPDTFRNPDVQSAALSSFTTTLKPPLKTTVRSKTTKAQAGLVRPPTLRTVERLEDHMINAFLEYTAILEANREVKKKECEDILKSFQQEKEGLLQIQLEEAHATIYNNTTSTVLRGQEMTHHMAAFSASSGVVFLDEERTRRRGHPVYDIPSRDPIVVVTRGTEIWLEDRILQASQILTSMEPPDEWTIPDITWVNGVPGCGKTTWIVNNFNSNEDVVATTTIQAKKDLVERIKNKAGHQAARRVRTLASLLVNGPKGFEDLKCKRLLIDEALMNHFGSIVMAAQTIKAENLLLIGDVNQIPYIDRENLFELHYFKPHHLADITQELLCTHRCPQDVAAALKHIHKGIYSSSNIIKSLSITPATGTEIPKALTNTLYLTYTQQEKSLLKRLGYGKGEASNILTIHEAQGLCYERVIVIKQQQRKLQLHDSASHAVVALTRHTRHFVYYTDNVDDALGKLVKGAMEMTTQTIMDYNTQMAIKNRDHTTIHKLASAGKP